MISFPNDLLAVGFGTLAALSLSVNALGIRKGSSYEGGSANQAMLVVLGTNIAIVLPAAVILHYPNYGVTLVSALAFVGTGLVGPLFGRLLYFNSIEKIGASRAEPFKGTTPLHATVLAILFLSEAVSLLHFLAIVVIVVGIAAISWDLSSGRVEAAHQKTLVVGALFALGAALLYGIEPIFAKFGFREGTPSLVGLAIKISTAVVSISIYNQLSGGFSVEGIFDGPKRNWYVLTGVANTTFLVSFYSGLALAPVAIVVPITQMTPLFVVVLSYLFLDDVESVTPAIVFGAVCTVVGAVTISYVG